MILTRLLALSFVLVLAEVDAQGNDLPVSLKQIEELTSKCEEEYGDDYDYEEDCLPLLENKSPQPIPDGKTPRQTPPTIPTTPRLAPPPKSKRTQPPRRTTQAPNRPSPGRPGPSPGPAPRLCWCGRPPAFNGLCYCPPPLQFFPPPLPPFFPRPFRFFPPPPQFLPRVPLLPPIPPQHRHLFPPVWGRK